MIFRQFSLRRSAALRVEMPIYRSERRGTQRAAEKTAYAPCHVPVKSSRHSHPRTSDDEAEAAEILSTVAECAADSVFIRVRFQEVVSDMKRITLIQE
jgi:hypothetical protein